MTSPIRSFTDLLAWTEAHKLVIGIYTLTKTFPKDEIFGLTNQMRRAAVSITSNIAEGFGRPGFKERVRFYCISKGSIAELKNQVLIARDVNIIDANQYSLITEKIDSAYRLLNGLIAKTKALSFSRSLTSNL